MFLLIELPIDLLQHVLRQHLQLCCKHRWQQCLRDARDAAHDVLALLSTCKLVASEMRCVAERGEALARRVRNTLPPFQLIDARVSLPFTQHNRLIEQSKQLLALIRALPTNGGLHCVPFGRCCVLKRRHFERCVHAPLPVLSARLVVVDPNATIFDVDAGGGMVAATTIGSQRLSHYHNSPGFP